MLEDAFIESVAWSDPSDPIIRINPRPNLTARTLLHPLPRLLPQHLRVPPPRRHRPRRCAAIHLPLSPRCCPWCYPWGRRCQELVLCWKCIGSAFVSEAPIYRINCPIPQGTLCITQTRIPGWWWPTENASAVNTSTDAATTAQTSAVFIVIPPPPPPPTTTTRLRSLLLPVPCAVAPLLRTHAIVLLRAGVMRR